MRMRRFTPALAFVVAASLFPLAGIGSAQTSVVRSKDSKRVHAFVRDHLGRPRQYSSGVQMWLNPPKLAPEDGELGPSSRGPAIGSNVDANDPNQDLAAGQSETAIGAFGDHVLVAWNDASSFLEYLDPLNPLSATGVAYSGDGGQTFTDLIGFPNDNANQQWLGDPAVVAIDSLHFVVASLYFPSAISDCRDGRLELTLGLEVATVTGASVSFSSPISPVNAGNLCGRTFKRSVSLLDKEFLAYDPVTRTLAMSYTRFYLDGRHSGLGQIEVVRATVPSDPSTFSEADFTKRVVIWDEEPYCDYPDPSSEATRCGAINEGAYPAVAPNGDTYVVWERNWQSNLFGGDPYVYLHAAMIPAGATEPAVGGIAAPLVFTKGQSGATPDGGVKSLTATQIVGYSRFIGNDLPRIAANPTTGEVVMVWNDASRHPLGDIFLRTAPFGLAALGPIEQVNDDSSFALHFLPAVSVGADGSIRTSWYDRRLSGADSADTDYFGEVRGTSGTNAPDFRITTGSTDWVNTGSLIDPNFGDYTDNWTTGTTTYYTWSDGRLGVPQPFVDSHS
jgi:hypothetical protein